MIHFIHNPPRFSHTNRSYLTQWFHKDVLIITDVDINEEANLEEMIAAHPCKNVLVDLSHNAMPESDIPEFLKKFTILSTMFDKWYGNYAEHGIHYFPLWLWMFSCRSNQFFGPTVFDANGHKTQTIMCLNRNPIPHRARLRQLLDPVVHDMVYTMDWRGLPGDYVEPHDQKIRIDISVGHPVYSQCAVNIVTETVVDRPSLSEKSCKPFVARQIPIIVGPRHANRFLSDLGLDMFEDLVPWKTWDDEPDVETKLQLISNFVISWVQSGTILPSYRSVTDRIERNKQYFHSDEFRRTILKRMPVTDPFTP